MPKTEQKFVILEKGLPKKHLSGCLLPGPLAVSSCILAFISLVVVVVVCVQFDLNEPLPLSPQSSSEAQTTQEDVDAQLKEEEEDDEEEHQHQNALAPSKDSWMQRLKIAGSRVKGAIKNAFSRMPKYFDFGYFVKNFNRNYLPSEYLYRRAVYLRNCLQVLKGRVAYRLGLSKYKQGVNKFSDRSPNEIKRMFMSVPPFEMRPKEQSEEEYYKQMEKVSAERAQWDLELESSASGEEDEVDDSSIIHEDQAKNQIERMLSDPNVDKKQQDALLEELNENDDEENSGDESSSPSSRPLPWPFQMKSPKVELDLNMDLSGTGYAYDKVYEPPKLEDVDDSIDWSKHRCFHQVYDQGEKCGKCYVMATVALAEFYKCSERVNQADRRKFSKDFVLYCGQKFSPTIMGCSGGSILDTLRFISISGMHSIKGWEGFRRERLKAMQKEGLLISSERKCPLNRLTRPLNQWGDIQVEMNPQTVHANDFYEALQDGPLVASVQMPSEGLVTYEGGVHDGAGCADSGNWHAMLLVGYGKDKKTGVPYWRFRNSWGADWGDHGHFNLAMSIPGECIAGGVRVYREPMA